jgi:hypothetical protein
MRVFDVYEHPVMGLRTVKRGFSWPAFIAPSVWAAAIGLGTTTLLLVIGSTLMFDVLKLATNLVSGPASMLSLFVASYLLFGLKPGVRGNAWYAAKLRKDGYRWKCVMLANSSGQALRALRSGRVRKSPEVLLANGVPPRAAFLAGFVII